MQKPEYSILIPNWNGADFIERAISSLIISAREYGRPYEFIVIDDASTDSSPETIKTQFPEVTLLKNKTNVGFGRTVNRVVKQANSPVVVLANNDLAVKEDFIRNLLDPFHDKEFAPLFGVSARTLNWTDGTPNHLNMTASFKNGMVELDYEDSQALCPTLFLQGGACALLRNVFLQLGGFSAIFHPGYWEDYDISYRAARMGYRLVYQPRALAYHFGKGSLMQLLGREGLNTISARNHFLFTWLNLRDPAMLTSHFLKLPVNLFLEQVSGDPPRLTKGCLKAAPRIFRVMRERRKRKEKIRVSDQRILSSKKKSRP